MARYDHLPIFAKMLELAVLVEHTAQHFSRYHKYTLGSELRGYCHRCLGLIAEANSTRERRELLLELRNTLERINIHLILAREVRAFHQPKAFFTAGELVVAVSRQNEGWLPFKGRGGRAVVISRERSDREIFRTEKSFVM